MNNIPLKFRLNPLFWYYWRSYKKQLLTNPLSPEMIEMAEKTGKVRELWRLSQRSVSDQKAKR